MADSNEYKQLLDVSRTLAEVVNELKQTNKNLSDITGSVSKDLKSISKSVTKDIPAKIDKASNTKEATDFSDDKEAQRGADILKSLGLDDLMADYQKEIEKLKASKSTNQDQQKKPIKGALKDGGKATEPGTYMVGENGPEIMEIPGGSKVIPLNVSDLIDGLNSIPQIKKMIKDGILNVEKSGGDNLLVGDDGKYSIESIKKRIQNQIAEDSAEGINTKSDSDKLTILDSLTKKISEQGNSAASSSATAESLIGAKGEAGSNNQKTIESIIAEKGGIGNMKLEDFYPSQSEVDAYVAKLIKEDPDIAEDGGGLDYEIDRFKFEEADRRFAEARKKAESTSAANTTSPELAKASKAEKSLSKREERKKSENAAEEGGKKGGIGEKIKSAVSGLSKLSETKPAGSLDDKLFGDGKKTENTVAGAAKTASGLLAKPASAPAGKKSETKVEKSNAALSKPSKPAPAEAPQATSAPQPPAPAAASSEAKSESSGGGGNSASASAPSKSGGDGSGSGGSAFGSGDMEIKALLGSIARSLSGPLNIYNPDPFRPDSRRI
jgi:hypothetical protein